MVCTPLPHEEREGRRVQQVWTVASTTNAVLELGDRLLCQGVQRVVMKATGKYWKPFFHPLEALGPECRLVNAREVNNVPGRPKTDRLDAVRLAKLAERGKVRASFVPPNPVRPLRDLTRTRIAFTQDRTRHKHRVEKALEDAQIKLSSVVSELDRHVSAPLGELAGPAAVAGGHDGAPTAAGRPGPELVVRLDAVPGVRAATAQIILAEIGLDMSRFPSPEHLVS
ncbi:transposase [Kitasatospora sp. NPDC056184]|uniref:IS110 family transposase n=1 Tax=Kitasatospora sp. NPDC056184 TaxID=3345738 RepID=UPI0035E277C8